MQESTSEGTVYASISFPFPCSMSCADIIFSNGDLPSVYGEQLIVLNCLGIPLVILWPRTQLYVIQSWYSKIHVVTKDIWGSFSPIILFNLDNLKRYIYLFYSYYEISTESGFHTTSQMIPNFSSLSPIIFHQIFFPLDTFVSVPLPLNLNDLIFPFSEICLPTPHTQSLTLYLTSVFLQDVA